MIKDSAKTILCYGDSNTWGNVPRSDDRYPRSVRWPGALQKILGEEYEVISEGLCGRTLTALDPRKLHRTGYNDVQAIVESADPLDILIIMLGTNDVKTTYNLDANEIAQDLEEFIALIRNPKLELAKPPEILIVCPPAVIVPSDGKLGERMINGPEIFKELPALFEEVAAKYHVHFLDAEKHVTSSKIDGYHLDSESHLKLAEVIGNKIKEIGI